MAARKLGLLEVPCLELAHLTDAQKRAYVIADNKLALNASWNESMLSLEVHDLHGLAFDVGLLGFNPDELKTLMYGVDFAPGSEDDQGKLDELAPKMTTCPHCGETYDLREHGQG